MKMSSYIFFIISSVSSSMNSLSAVTWKDMMEWKFYYLPEWKKALITKVLAAGYGIIGIFFAFFFGITPGNVLQVLCKKINQCGFAYKCLHQTCKICLTNNIYIKSFF